MGNIEIINNEEPVKEKPINEEIKEEIKEEEIKPKAKAKSKSRAKLSLIIITNHGGHVLTKNNNCTSTYNSYILVVY